MKGAVSVSASGTIGIEQILQLLAVVLHKRERKHQKNAGFGSFQVSGENGSRFFKGFAPTLIAVQGIDRPVVHPRGNDHGNSFRKSVLDGRKRGLVHVARAKGLDDHAVRAGIGDMAYQRAGIACKGCHKNDLGQFRSAGKCPAVGTVMETDDLAVNQTSQIALVA